jgi:hypothetical protein
VLETSANHSQLRDCGTLLSTRDEIAQVTRPIETVGCILPVPILGGVHHRYTRISCRQGQVQ